MFNTYKPVSSYTFGKAVVSVVNSAKNQWPSRLLGNYSYLLPITKGNYTHWKYIKTMRRRKEFKNHTLDISQTQGPYPQDPGPCIPKIGIGHDLPHKAPKHTPWGLLQKFPCLSLPSPRTLLLAASNASFYLFCFPLPVFAITFH